MRPQRRPGLATPFGGRFSTWFAAKSSRSWSRPAWTPRRYRQYAPLGGKDGPGKVVHATADLCNRLRRRCLSRGPSRRTTFVVHGDPGTNAISARRPAPAPLPRSRSAAVPPPRTGDLRGVSRIFPPKVAALIEANNHHPLCARQWFIVLSKHSFSRNITCDLLSHCGLWQVGPSSCNCADPGRRNQPLRQHRQDRDIPKAGGCRRCPGTPPPRGAIIIFDGRHVEAQQAAEQQSPSRLEAPSRRHHAGTRWQHHQPPATLRLVTALPRRISRSLHAQKRRPRIRARAASSCWAPNSASLTAMATRAQTRTAAPSPPWPHRGSTHASRRPSGKASISTSPHHSATRVNRPLHHRDGLSQRGEDSQSRRTHQGPHAGRKGRRSYDYSRLLKDCGSPVQFRNIWLLPGEAAEHAARGDCPAASDLEPGSAVTAEPITFGKPAASSGGTASARTTARPSPTSFRYRLASQFESRTWRRRLFDHHGRFGRCRGMAAQVGASAWWSRRESDRPTSCKRTGANFGGQIWKRDHSQPPARWSLPVKLHTQETNNWCWAASGEMVMAYFGRDVSHSSGQPRTQTQRLRHAARPPLAIKADRRTHQRVAPPANGAQQRLPGMRSCIKSMR